MSKRAGIVFTDSVWPCFAGCQLLLFSSVSNAFSVTRTRFLNPTRVTLSVSLCESSCAPPLLLSFYWIYPLVFLLFLALFTTTAMYEHNKLYEHALYSVIGLIKNCTFVSKHKQIFSQTVNNFHYCHKFYKNNTISPTFWWALLAYSPPPGQ